MARKRKVTQDVTPLDTDAQQLVNYLDTHKPPKGFPSNPEQIRLLQDENDRLTTNYHATINELNDARATYIDLEHENERLRDALDAEARRTQSIQEWGQRQHDALMETSQELDTMYDRCGDLKHQLIELQSEHNAAFQNIEGLDTLVRSPRVGLPEAVADLASALRVAQLDKRMAETRQAQTEQTHASTVASFERLTRILEETRDEKI